MKEQEIQQKYMALWDKYKKLGFETELLERGFLFQYDEGIINPDILFLGINPSFKEGEAKIKGSYSQNKGLKHPYFKAFYKILDHLKVVYETSASWTHIDLLVFRETKKKYIDLLISKDLGPQFIMDVLNVSKEHLEYINPKVIVCSNTMARKLMGKDKHTVKGEEQGIWMGYDFELDTELGTYIITSGILKGTPVLFTSMLSGQRAMDNGSKERLVWHINRALKNR